jgi:hypothetical protein
MLKGATKLPCIATSIFMTSNYLNELFFKNLDFDNDKQEVLKETQYSYQKKMGVTAERKETKLEKQEADR